MERRIVELRLAGNSVRRIAQVLKTGDRRISRVLAQAEAFGYLNGTPLPVVPQAIFPKEEPAEGLWTSDVDKVLIKHRDWIIERLHSGWRPVTVWEELPEKVGRSSFYRFLERHKLDNAGARHRLVPEIVHTSGEALLVDWGKLRTVRDADGAKKILWAFVGVLGFSRYMMVRLVWSNDVPTTVLALESMLAELGGVPRRVTSDNPKCFAIEASKYEPLLNPVLERWSAHYGTVLECLPPGDPEKKGKVERLMPYVRRLYEAHGDEWLGLEESQSYLDRKVAIANERRHGTTGLRPIDDFKNSERNSLKPLPALTYELEDFHEGEVRGDGYVRFKNKYYSTGEENCGKHVVVLGTKTQVSIYLGGQLLEVHGRIVDPHISKSTKPHHLKKHEQVMTDCAFYIKRAERIGLFTAQLVEAILGAGNGFVDTRKVWGILSLDKNHKPEAIEKACKLALEMDEPSFRRVQSLLKIFPRELEGTTTDPQSKQAANDHKFVRDLEEYKRLCIAEQKEGSHECTNAE